MQVELMEFKIPYESSKVRGSGLALLNSYVEGKKQMPYDFGFVQDGVYREWITRMTDEDLEKFIQKNEKEMQGVMGIKITGPNERRFNYLMYRNCVYMVELHLRHNTDTVRLDEDLHNYEAEWRGKFQRAALSFVEGEVIGTTEPNPYY
jgi:hypothetical protein